MKRIKFFACALALGLALVGCTAFCFGAASTPGPSSSTAPAAPERVVLFDTRQYKNHAGRPENHRRGQARRDSVHIQKTLTVRTSTPTLEERQARALGRVSADTDTIKIVVSGDLIAVTDKTAGLNYYIH